MISEYGLDAINENENSYYVFLGARDIPSVVQVTIYFSDL